MLQQPQQWNNILLQLRTNKITWLFIIAAILLFTGIGSTPMYILDEARNAQAAREMMERNDWIVPTFNGELRAHKPPLHYYFMQIAYRVFGMNAFSTRFFSAVFGWLTIWITWFFTRRFVSYGTAIWAVAVLLVSTHFLFEFRMSVPDPYLIFFITAGIFCFYAYTQERTLKWLICSAVAAALATLAKGPVALALPALVLVWWVLSLKKYELLFSWHLLLYAAVIVLVALPWYVIVHQATHGEFTRVFFFEHNFNRFGEPMEGHGGLFIMVPLFVLLGLLPVSVFTGELVKKVRLYHRNNFIRLCMYVVAVFIVFFSVSGTKLPNYPMPCYPFMAVLLGYFINKVITGQIPVKQYPLWLLLLLNVLLFTAAWVGLGLETATQPFRGWALLFAIPVITTAGSWWFFKKEGLKKAMHVIIAGYSVFNFLFLAIGYPAIYQHNPVTKTLHLLPKNSTVYAYKIYNPAYNFYLNNSIKVLESPAQVNEVITTQPQAVIISRENHLLELEAVPVKLLAKERDLFETATTVLLSGK
ncbi:glycosyltransferase family 39 protein [Niastella caeni]|uniref:Glycosyltransferase family 39 protein n=1 Tax=Niastella caeni TaxID=2569763 RepID=A0A4S8HUG0_9BACT|nr:glycosyltransferase family 39 protein [Niastella caeni]THU39243.1 glycosyltransferase family 39 protein [Niastella caeni]